MEAERMDARAKKDRTGHLYLRGKTYWLQYQIGGRRFRESLKTRNEREANEKRKAKMAPFLVAHEVEALQVVQARLSAATEQAVALQDSERPPLTVQDAWGGYLESETRPQSGPETLKQYASHWKQFARWLAAREHPPLYLREITPELAGEYAREVLGKQGLSANRYNKNIVFLRCLFRSLATPARLTVNPFDGMARRKHVPISKRPLTVAELKRVLTTADGELQTLLFIGTFTGLRLGDAATLRWSEVDIDRGIVRRIPNKTARTGRPVVVGIPVALAQKLKAIPAANGEEFIMPGIARQYLRPSTRPALSVRIQTHLKSCGIRTVRSGTGKGGAGRAVVEAGFHSLRHSYITFHAEGGTPQPVLMKMAGHGNPIMTEHYVHLSDETARLAVAALPAILHDSRHRPRRGGLPMKLPDKAVRLLKQMSPKSWKRIRDQLLQMEGATL